MKLFINVFPIIICSMLMAAHLLRMDLLMAMLISLLIPFLLFWKHKISIRIIQLFLILSGLEWIRTLVFYVQLRIENEQDWIRLAFIIGIVALLNFATLLVFKSKKIKKNYNY